MMKSAAKLFLVFLPFLITKVEAAELPVVTVSSIDRVTPEVSQAADTLDAGLPIEPGEKSPLFSMLRSAVVPGWGQFHTGHPYRGSFFFTLEGILFTFAWAENYRADRDWESYRATGDSRYLDEYDRHFNRGRDLMSYAIAIFLINIADAYVSAHLYDFEGKVTFDEERQAALSMNWQF